MEENAINLLFFFFFEEIGRGIWTSIGEFSVLKH